ncbi:MAG: glycosyltransferase [Chloroflexota bacterium]
MSEPDFVPVMSSRQRLAFRCAVAVWLLALVSFWSWWLQAEHVVTWIGMLLNSALLLWTTCLPAWCFFFVDRMKQPNTAVALPDGRVAMIVTKAPSEPWPMVRRTLEAMLAQSFPEPRDFFLVFRRRSTDTLRTFDVWLADEDPNEETVRWCAAHGVQLSSRKGVAEYNNPAWPGRERCKEGNLRYFYEARDGYANYDFVVQLDADHVPTPNYLIEMLRPFTDARVGYVAAPSICDANAGESWSARARLYAEASLHGSLQAGYSNGYAPLCIGSHYAVRTTALMQIGGLGPELAEDHTTSLMMNAAGWRGAFALDAIAHGDGPSSLADCITQEFQWSRSLAKVLLACTPGHWRDLNLRGKVEFGFAQLWYPLFAAHLLVAFLVPPVALLIGTPWVDVDLAEFLIHSTVLTLCTIAPVYWIHRQGWFRPAESKLMSWEAVLFQLVRWPWVLLGVCQAFIGWLLHKEFTFKVTPKGMDGAQSLPLSVVVPYCVMALVQAAAAIAAGNPGDARGYYYFVLLNGLLYTLVSVAVTALHLRESLRHSSGRARAWASTALRVVPVLGLAGVSVGVAVMLRADATVAAIVPMVAERFSAASPQAATIPPIADGGAATASVDLGQLPVSSVPIGGLNIPIPELLQRGLVESGHLVQPQPVRPVALSEGRLNIGAYDPSGDSNLESLSIEHSYTRQDRPDLLAAALTRARNRRLPMVTIEPYPARGMQDPVLDRIAAGDLDSQVRRMAQIVRDDSPQVVLVRWGHEMEISGLYPWAANQPDLYRLAFRRVVGIFREEGASNARFVWSPAGNAGAEAYYPGGDVVDYVGMTVLEDEAWDWGFGLPTQSFADLLRPRYDRLEQFGKLLLVAELGVSGTPERQAAWLAEAAHALPAFPKLRALVYFDATNPPVRGLEVLPDWRIQTPLLRRLVDDVTPQPIPDNLAAPDSGTAAADRQAELRPL